jgi:dihydropteroate synthase
LARVVGTQGAGALLSGGLACAALAVRDGAQLVRVHDVAETVRAIRVAEAIEAQRRNK